MIEPAAGVPLGPLVTVGRYSTHSLDQARQMQQIPGHKGGVAIGEIVFRPARAGVQITFVLFLVLIQELSDGGLLAGFEVDTIMHSLSYPGQPALNSGDIQLRAGQEG